MPDIIDQLTNAQLDKLQQRLEQRGAQRKAEKDAAERERNNPRPLRPQIGNGGHMFGNERARRNWDRECIEAGKGQTVQYAVAPGTSVLARNGKRLGAGEEVRPTEHLDGQLGDPMIQVQQLVERGFVIAKEISP